MPNSIEKLKPLINLIEDHIGTTFSGYTVMTEDISDIPIRSDNNVDKFYKHHKPISLVVNTTTGFTYTYSSTQGEDAIKRALEYLERLTVTKIDIGEEYKFQNICIGDELIINGQTVAVTKVNSVECEDDDTLDTYTFYCCMKEGLDDLEYERLIDEGFYDIMLKDKLLIGSIHIKQRRKG